MLICDLASHTSVKYYVEQLSVLLSHFSWLPDSFMLEFFTDNHWKKLPMTWRAVLDTADFDELADFLNYAEPMVCKPGKVVWPLSLQALRAAVRVYSLSRRPLDDSREVAEFVKRISDKNNSRLRLDSLRWKSVDEQLTSAGAANRHDINRRTVNSFRRSIKSKKLHEIARVAQVVNMVAEQSGADLAVDVGSGHGHLSRLLTLGFGLRVLSLEAEQTHVMDAQTLDCKVFEDFKKINRNYSEDSSPRHDLHTVNCSEEKAVHEVPKHFLYKIDASVTAKEFLEACHSVGSTESNKSKRFVQVGLHTCGNLAQTMLRVHSECAESVAVVSVACCYMKLDDRRAELDCSPGYPMSQFVSSLPRCGALSYEAKEVACHAIEHYIQRLRNNSESLKIHCLRATLETIITKVYPHMKRIGLRSVKGAEKLSFSEYACRALERVHVELPFNDLVSDEVNAKISQWRQVIAFYSLRLLLAPVVETLILLDRCLFLWEKGNPSLIVPIFEPILSPRNHVLISMK